MTREQALIRGYFTAATVPSILALAYITIQGLMESDGLSSFNPFALLFGGLFFYVAALIFIAMVGSPMFLLLQKLKFVNLGSLLALGALGGAATILLLNIVFGILPESGPLMAFTLMGTASAFAFWLVFRQARPSPKARSAGTAD